MPTNLYEANTITKKNNVSFSYVIAVGTTNNST